jgi:predicted RNase H-like nuclease (RuvC/YqgF family)
MLWSRTSRELELENRALRSRLARMRDERDDAREDAEMGRRVRQTMARQVDELETAARRAQARADRLAEQLEEVRQAPADADFVALQLRLERALRAAAGYRRELADQSHAADRLSTQLLDSMGYSRDERRALGLPVTAGREPGVSGD